MYIFRLIILPAILFIVSVGLAPPILAAEPVVLSNDEKEYLLTDYLHIYEDKDKKYSIQEVSLPDFRKNFTVNTESYRYAENPSSAYWIRIEVKNTSDIKKWVFEVLSLHTQNFQIYIPDENFIDGEAGKRHYFHQYLTGQNFNFKNREYKIKNFIFDLPSIKSKIYPIYIRVESDNGASFEYKIRSQEYFTEYTTSEYLYLGLYYGFLIFLIIYNFFLFTTSKEKAYIFYILFIFSSILISLESDGFGFQYLWSNLPWINKLVSSYWPPILFLLTFIFYAKNFIASSPSYPSFTKFLPGVTILYILCEITQILPGLLITYFYLVPFLLIYAIAIHGYFKGAIANRYFIIGQTLLLISIFITRLSWYGIVDSNIFTVYSFNFGVLLEAVVFSYAFIDKYRLIKQEKEKAQQDTINQLKKNKILQTKVNRELEEKVAERTKLLQQEKEKLNQANKKLELLMEEVNTVNSKLDYHNWQLNRKVKEETKARILAKEVSFEEFQKIFPNEIACLSFLEELKWAKEYQCKKCGNKKYTPLKKLLSRRCSKCSYIESATSATLFHALKFPIDKAFYIAYYCSFSDNRMTIDELSSLLNLRRNTCWNFKKRVFERIEITQQNGKNKDKKKWEALFLD